MLDLPMKREVRPAQFGLGAKRNDDGSAELMVALPFEGETWLFTLGADLVEQLRNQLSGTPGLHVASAGELPPEPPVVP